MHVSKACFDLEMPQTPSNKNGTTSEGELKFPFTSLILAGLKIGLSEQRLMTMSYSRLLFYLEANRDMNSDKQSDTASNEIRMATQDDISLLL